MNLLRSLLYLLIQSLSTIPFALLALASFPFDLRTRYQLITGWTRLNLWAMRHILGVQWQVLGRENIPPEASVVLAKHQSAWETLAFQEIFPPQVYVLKKELLRIPFFGWGLSMLPMIAIDRGARKNALAQIKEQGAQRLEQGWWVVIFPEGTRAAPGTSLPFMGGGAMVATHAHRKVLPVAHNAADVWPRNAFIKKPGQITVSIGPAIDTHGLRAGEVNRKAQAWIEQEMRRLFPHQYEETLNEVASG